MSHPSSCHTYFHEASHSSLKRHHIVLKRGLHLCTLRSSAATLASSSLTAASSALVRAALSRCADCDCAASASARRPASEQSAAAVVSRCSRFVAAQWDKITPACFHGLHCHASSTAPSGMMHIHVSSALQTLPRAGNQRPAARRLRERCPSRCAPARPPVPAYFTHPKNPDMNTYPQRPPAERPPPPAAPRAGVAPSRRPPAPPPTLPQTLNPAPPAARRARPHRRLLRLRAPRPRQRAAAAPPLRRPPRKPAAALPEPRRVLPVSHRHLCSGLTVVNYMYCHTFYSHRYVSSSKCLHTHIYRTA